MDDKRVQPKRELNVVEKKAIQKLKDRGVVKGKEIFNVVDGNPGTDEIRAGLAFNDDLLPHDSCKEYQARIFEASGFVNQIVGMQSIIKAGEAVTPSSADTKRAVHIANITAQAVAAIGPEDEVEGQLISQLVVLHEQAMTWLGKSIRADRVDFANIYLNGASKLLTRHHEALASLMKYRRGGEQRVHVEHVHVHNGGKAVVGNIGPGGVKKKNEEGPHAKV